MNDESNIERAQRDWIPVDYPDEIRPAWQYCLRDELIHTWIQAIRPQPKRGETKRKLAWAAAICLLLAAGAGAAWFSASRPLPPIQEIKSTNNHY
jgi:hypothetical protein